MVTTIKIHEATKLELDRLREHPRESYDEVIRKLARIVKIDSAPLSRKALNAIAASREHIRQGRVYSMEEVRKRLGL